VDKKTLNCSILSSKKHRQYESNKVNNNAKNTRSVQEMEYIKLSQGHKPHNFVRFLF